MTRWSGTRGGLARVPNLPEQHPNLWDRSVSLVKLFYKPAERSVNFSLNAVQQIPPAKHPQEKRA